MQYSQDMLTVLMYWLCSFDNILFDKVTGGDFNSSEWAVTATDEHSTLLYTNSSFDNLLGFESGELAGLNAFEVLDDDAWSRMQGHFENYLRTKSKFECDILELTYLHKDGTPRVVEEIARCMTVNGRHYVLSLIYLPDQKDQKDRELTYYLNELEEEFLRLNNENTNLKKELEVHHKSGPIIGKSKVFKDVLAKVEKIAVTDATVLVQGETGTGKELLARLIHERSMRQSKTMVKVNCAALPPTLMESELFGHVKGSFTDAVTDQPGRFQRADGGTIFLDEIGELPLFLQAKLLRVLQEKEINRVGDSKTIHVDVRIIAATNRDLLKEVQKGNFREDLYYRLNVLPVTSPPLRERKEDIPLFIQYFVDHYNRKLGKQVDVVSKEISDRLCRYDWPGNVRELENLIERNLILTTGRTLKIESLERPGYKPGEHATHLKTLVEVEQEYIIQILEKTGWRVSGEKGAAKVLGINPKTLESRLKKYGIQRPSLLA